MSIKTTVKLAIKWAPIAISIIKLFRDNKKDVSSTTTNRRK